MSERKPKHPPVSGERLEQVAREFADPEFLDRLTGLVRFYASEWGLLRGSTLPGGEDCKGLAMQIVTMILAGRRQWKEEHSFLEACFAATKSEVNNWLNKAANKFEWTQVDSGIEEYSDEDDGRVVYPPDLSSSPDELILGKEAQERVDSALLDLADLVGKGTLEEKILEGFMFKTKNWERPLIIKTLGCTGAEFDAAKKRLQRLAATLKRGE